MTMHFKTLEYLDILDSTNYMHIIRNRNYLCFVFMEIFELRIV